MRKLKLYEKFIRESQEQQFAGNPSDEESPDEMSVSDVPGHQSSAAVLNLSNNKDGVYKNTTGDASTITKKINQSQFNKDGAIRYKDIDGLEKPEYESSPFMKEPGEEYPIADIPNGLTIVYQGTSYKVVSKS